MQVARAVGRGAAARKYDLLSAMGALALSKGKAEQRMVLRLMTLITARYNWQKDLLACGQREIARLWACDERTVKREMARLRGLGWLLVRRQGARGRVTEYSLGIETILSATEPAWPAVGPDFVLRMGQGAAEETVVPFPVTGQVPAPDISTGSEWALAQALLHQEDEALYAAWVRGLVLDTRQGAQVTLRAPSRFHAAYVQTHLETRILAALQAVDDGVSDLRITC